MSRSVREIQKNKKRKIHSGENKQNGQGWDHLDEKKMGAASHDDRIVPAKRRLSLELKKTASIVYIHTHIQREREREKPKIFKRRRRRRDKRFVWRSRTRLASWTIVRCLAGPIGSSLFEVRLKTPDESRFSKVAKLRTFLCWPVTRRSTSNE